jgi:hypothetical protein
MQSVPKADNLTAICESIVLKMWKPRRLNNLWASTAYYRDNFAFFTLRFSDIIPEFRTIVTFAIVNLETELTA